MAVDKNLFMYNLAVVAIMKNEEHYVKEWLDYYLLAGVDHFYIYDNDSTDRTKEIIQPYVDAGVVTYTFYPGQAKLMESYNDAIRRFKFYCRYMSFIDSDEFILPIKGNTISEAVEELFTVHPLVSGVDINWRFYGSNFQEEADFSRGLLDRFTRCAAKDSNSHKTLTNPRRINYMATPHYAFYFGDCFSMNKNLINAFPQVANISDRLIMNHYYWKSHEEYTIKANRGTCAATQNYYSADNFKHADNDIVDDRIVKYRDTRISELLKPEKSILESLAPSKAINYNRLFDALIHNLSLTFGKGIDPRFLNGKMETFLTCLALSTYLKNTLLDDSVGKFLEEISLKAIYKTFMTSIQLHEAELLIRELPNILPLNYPVVNDIRKTSIDMISYIKENLRQRMTTTDMNKLMLWKDITEWDYIESLLKIM